MFEKLKKNNLNYAIKICMEGLEQEIPVCKFTHDETKKFLEDDECFLYKENSEIQGLIVFKFPEDGNVYLKFMYAVQPRKGIGTKLLLRVAEYAKDRSEYILTLISTKDNRAMSFYNKLGFKKYAIHEKKDYLIKSKIKIKDLIKNIKEQ